MKFNIFVVKHQEYNLCLIWLKNLYIFLYNVGIEADT